MSEGAVRLTRLTSLDGIEPLAEAARAEGFEFLDRLIREWVSGANRFEGANEALYGTFVGDTLVGTAGLTFQRPGLGRVRRVYVRSDFRRKGVARRLMAEVLAFARAHYPEVALYTGTVEAARLYEGMAFVPESPGGMDHATHRLVLSPSN